ncbi:MULTISPECIES: glycine cleavage system protein GcvH [unclassified Pseudactinotalea]|uniref:glycine cleavage system protein GcvH n=1 Tax=unclassified Pseudactinotalea TaxID=2649176 RepID=UPI00128DB032|nr:MULTISPECIES: glycine cleavage system protein GcvH [unclassified Pseudactinotalea]MPV49430.1 glycine cleavage system protein GcvH [Pseudactinotalea sp. HY160]QGH69279.1 glycine cleavage system protein GcvH [Pseudactinotalea sp. HY158]
MSHPTDRAYTAEHEWVRIEAGVATVGVTSYATEALGDVVYVDLPEVGTEVIAGAACGEIESTKSVSDLFSPVSGTVSGVNSDLEAHPERVDADPYGQGWLFTVTVTDVGPTMDAAAYAASVRE